MPGPRQRGALHKPRLRSELRKRRAREAIFIEALRTIQPGEELCYDYQIQRDDDDPPDVDQVFACCCGAQSCRGSMLEPRKATHSRKVRPPRFSRKKAPCRGR